MIYPKSDLTIKRIHDIKDTTKRALLEKATNGWKKPVTDFVLREVVWGETACTDVYDMIPADRVGSAGIPAWGFDSSDLVINNLKSVVEAGSTVDDNKWIGIYGWFDVTPEEGLAATSEIAGNATAVQFKRGSSVLDLWKLSHLYAHDEVVGFTDTPIIWEENESYDVLINVTEDADLWGCGLRGYVCESVGLGHLNPSPSMDVMARATRGVSSVAQLPQSEQIDMVMRAGMDPVAEMSQEEISRLYTRAKLGLYTLIVESGEANSISEAKRDYYIRHFHAADDTMVDTYLDVDLSSTSGAARADCYANASDISTAGDLTNMFGTGQTVNDRDFVALFGMIDRTTNSSLLEIAPGDSGGNLDFCDVQHLYAYHDDIRGYTQRITYYRQNAAIAYKVSVGVVRDNYVVPIGLIAEPYGSVVSQT